MIHDVFSIYDVKADAYLPPFILPNKQMALRVFADCVNSDSHQFALNPQDYTLFQLGQFNDEDGRFLLQNCNNSLGNGIEFVRKDSPTATEGRSNGKADESQSSLSDGAPVQSSSTG